MLKYMFTFVKYNRMTLLTLFLFLCLSVPFMERQIFDHVEKCKSLSE